MNEEQDESSQPPTSLTDVAIALMVSQLALLRTLSQTAVLDVEKYNRLLDQLGASVKIGPAALQALRLPQKEPPKD